MAVPMTVCDIGLYLYSRHRLLRKLAKKPGQTSTTGKWLHSMLCRSWWGLRVHWMSNFLIITYARQQQLFESFHLRAPTTQHFSLKQKHLSKSLRPVPSTFHLVITFFIVIVTHISGSIAFFSFRIFSVGGHRLRIAIQLNVLERLRHCVSFHQLQILFNEILEQTQRIIQLVRGPRKLLSKQWNELEW